jgi:hypothetical protein
MVIARSLSLARSAAKRAAGAVLCRSERRVGLSAAVWLSLFFIARGMLEVPSRPTYERVLLAIMPLPAFAWFIWEFTKGVAAADELERRIQLEALAVAFPLTIFLLMTLGLLQVAIDLPMEDWSYRHIWPLIYVFYLIGLTVARRRYQ